MNRLFKITALFATVISLSLLANEVLANGQSKPTAKKGTVQISSQLQKQQNSSSPTQATQPTQPSLVYHVPAGGWKAVGGLFNQPKRTLPYHIPPGGWKAVGGLFNHPTPPTTPPKGTGMGHGSGFGFGGGSFGGSAVATTTTPVLDQPAAPATPAPVAQTATDSDAANAMQVAAGSTITLNGESFGDKAGRVGVVVGGILIPADVTNWSDKAVTITLPPVGVEATAKAMFVVQRADGSTAKEMNFEMVAAK